jgi:hypothetical protein
MMPDYAHAQRLLDRIAVLRGPCDLDLLIFLAKQRRALLANEQIADLLGYELKQINTSSDLLVGAGLVTRMTNGPRGTQMYVLPDADTTRPEWLSELLRVASTREGRLAMLRALKRAESNPLAAPAERPRPNGDRKVEGADAGR